MRRAAASLPPNAALVADIAVVGSGPMGITTALELARSGHRVTLIESGHDKYDDATQRLSDNARRQEDHYHVKKELSVRRQVGGTSALWGGRCVPFDRIDFEQRPAVPEALWPVSYDEIAQFLPRACEWCACGRSVWDVNEIHELATRDLVPSLKDSDVRTTELERWALPTRFGKVYGPALDTHPNIDLITGLTCTEIITAADGSNVDHLVLRTLSGGQATIRAEQFVLAPGGLEATRLLLASRRHHPDGIGGESGHLGRWYMAHVEARVAEAHFTTPPGETIYEHERDIDGVYVRRRFTFTPELQRRDGLLNGATWIVNPEMGDARHRSGILSGVYLTLISPIGKFLLAEAIRQAGTKTKSPGSFRAHARNIASDFFASAAFAVSFTYRRFLRRGRKAPGFFVRSGSNVYPLHYHGEHLPHWESRVELTEEVDGLGLPRLRTHMHFSEKDVKSVGEAMNHIDEHLRERGVGYIRYLYENIDEGVNEYLAGNAGYHQTGTTRMSEYPEDGVVDPNLRVHGIDNLFVGSTSVFPTSSQANPTLTGVAFAVRLAGHIAGELQSAGDRKIS